MLERVADGTAERSELEQAPAREQRAGSTSDSADPSDEALELQWKQGSAPAFAILFERWHKRAYAYAYRRSSGNAALAEEVAQRAFVNLYSRPPAGEGGSFKALLFTVVENELRTEARKRGRRKETDLDVTLETREGDSLPPSAPVERAEERARIAAALETLPEEERTCVLLREVEGLTFREVCEATGLTRDVVRGRLSRALAHLRRVLGRKP
jgi:RNA polymerase sigma-70 factor (ECF subfamily)